MGAVVSKRKKKMMSDECVIVIVETVLENESIQTEKRKSKGRWKG